LALTGAAGAMVVVAVPASPAAAVDNNYVDVTVLDTAFNPTTVYARPGDIVRFTLGTGVSTQHTVTLEAGTCNGRPNQLCERTFDDTHRTVMFRFSSSDTYPYFDRIARDAGNNDMRGTIVISDQPPVTSTTSPPTTAPRATTTTTAPTTTTTEAGSIHPFLVYDPPPAPTTTTTAPTHLSVVTIPAPGKTGTGAAAAADSGKGKAKAASGSTTTTAPGAPAVPDPSILVPASLIPTPEAPPPTVSSDSDTPVDDVTSTASDLLHNDRSDDGTRLLVISLVALAVFLLGAGTFGWYRRSSRYFPA